MRCTDAYSIHYVPRVVIERTSQIARSVQLWSRTLILWQILSTFENCHTVNNLDVAACFDQELSGSAKYLTI